jgi:hypothetical protein
MTIALCIMWVRSSSVARSRVNNVVMHGQCTGVLESDRPARVSMLRVAVVWL